MAMYLHEDLINVGEFVKAFRTCFEDIVSSDLGSQFMFNNLGLPRWRVLMFLWAQDSCVSMLSVFFSFFLGDRVNRREQDICIHQVTRAT